MKSIIYLFSFLTFLFVLSSCEEVGLFGYDTDLVNNPYEKSGFKATVDGVDLFTENASFAIDGADILISAINPETNEVFTVKVVNYATGTFDFQGTDNVATYVNNSLSPINTWSTNNATTSKGNIEFTDIDTENSTVSGTFNFLGDDLNGTQKTFTGSFTNIVKTELPPSSNLFTAKIDGVQFTGITVFGSVDSQNNLLITASDILNENYFEITLDADIIVDNHVMNRNSNPKGVYKVNGSTYYVKNNEGEFVISSHDIDKKIITGTFYFLAKPETSLNPRFIVNYGNFSISY